MAVLGQLDDADRCGSRFRAISALSPPDHLLCRVDLLIDMRELRAVLAYLYIPRGRPSINPELLIRMISMGCIYAITSERTLWEKVRYNSPIGGSAGSCSG